MDDLISRQAAIDALDKHCDVVCQYSKKQRHVMCGACALGTAFDVIEQLPSAQPERKNGRWKDGYDECVCSECNMGFNYVDNCTETFNYCPNCGAEMGKDGE